MNKQHQQILEKYNFRREKPLFSINNYSVWEGSQKETNVPVTIKTIKYPHVELPKYLKKLKEMRSDFVIKIFELVVEQTSILLITEQVTYGTLKKALSSCEHLDQNDSLFVAKALLNGHVDILRDDGNWFGTEDDIQFTDSGIKLSWNNSCAFNLVNPFPNILSRLVTRTEAVKSNTLLPFPEVKGVNELIKVCKENASEISLHPQMKTKVKFSKRKGQGWMGLRQVKGKNQYFDELTFFAVSLEHGFVRVKVYEAGKISPNLLAFNKNRNTFTRVLNTYDEGDKTIVISSYANDGNLENYVKRIKSNGISLKEEHIQFFFYSMFDPLKSVQQSTLKSINMFHIKNIFIENGIPKIGEPVPINSKVLQILTDRADVPDFYHSGFKRDPTSHDVTYDTYSLGVLLYKLMYTEYPIFPNGRVHIPTTPNYNKRLKTTLEIFLNEGGSLLDLEKKIEVSENVLKQVQENKQKLMQGFGPTKKQKKVRKVDSDEEESERPETGSKVSLVEEQVAAQSAVSEDDDDEDGCCSILLSKLKLSPAEKLKQTYHFLDVLEQSPYRKCRIWTKIILTMVLYLFMFYYQFLVNNTALISDRSIVQKINVTIGSTNYPILTTNYYNFQTNFATTSQTVSGLQGSGLWCAIEGYNGSPTYSTTLNTESNLWLGYILSGVLTMVVMLIIKAAQVNVLDEIRAWNYRQNGKGKFNLTNFFIFALMFQTLIAGHFFLFNFIYYGQLDPCFGFPNSILYGSTVALFQDQNSFINIYVAAYAAQIIIAIIYLIFIGCNQRIPYSRVLNPITTFGVATIVFFLMIRIGAILGNSFYPSASNDSSSVIMSMFKRGEMMGILGVFPEILLFIELAIAVVVDWIFYALLDKGNSLLSNDASIANDGLNDLV